MQASIQYQYHQSINQSINQSIPRMFPAQVQDISSGSVVTKKNVWRHPACSGGEYVSKNGFRVLSSSAHAANLIEDFTQLFGTKPCTTPPPYISYHAAVAAVQHSLSCAAFLFFERSFFERNNIRCPYRRQGQVIARVMSSDELVIALAKVQMQVTELSALRRYQCTRILGGPMVALLALKLAYGGGSSNTNGTVDCRVRHTIMRRALGSEQRAIHVARPYIRYARNHSEYVSRVVIDNATREMKIRYDDHAPIVTKRSELFNGPSEFHKAEFYANKCIRLIEGDDAARKWRDLEEKIQRVRRGELTVHDVMFDPSDNYWVFSVYHTFYCALKNYIGSNTKWLTNWSTVQSTTSQSTTSKSTTSKPGVWRSLYSSESGIAINKDSKSYVQTTQMIHTMYAFLLRTQNILSDKFISVFGFSNKFRNTVLMRLHHLSSVNGDEASALMLGQFIPCLMTPEIHMDINVCTRGFQESHFYVKMSSRVFGKLKKRFKHLIPARHNGVIDRTTFMTAVYSV
jgi:hypothetical protein